MRQIAFSANEKTWTPSANSLQQKGAPCRSICTVREKYQSVTLQYQSLSILGSMSSVDNDCFDLKVNWKQLGFIKKYQKLKRNINLMSFLNKKYKKYCEQLSMSAVPYAIRCSQRQMKTNQDIRDILRGHTSNQGFLTLDIQAVAPPPDQSEIIDLRQSHPQSLKFIETSKFSTISEVKEQSLRSATNDQVLNPNLYSSFSEKRRQVSNDYNHEQSTGETLRSMRTTIAQDVTCRGCKQQNFPGSIYQCQRCKSPCQKCRICEYQGKEKTRCRVGFRYCRRCRLRHLEEKGKDHHVFRQISSKEQLEFLDNVETPSKMELPKHYDDLFWEEQQYMDGDEGAKKFGQKAAKLKLSKLTRLTCSINQSEMTPYIGGIYRCMSYERVLSIINS